MKGLILKDLLQLKTYCKTLILIFIFFIAVSFVNKDYSFVSVIIIVLSCMMTVTTFAYDNVGKWDNFVLTMPIKRNKIVLGKYVLALILSSLGTIIAFASTCILNFINKFEFSVENTITIGIGVEIAIILVSIMIPLVYIFGVEKSRYIFMIVVLIPTLIGMLGIGIPSEENLKVLLEFSPIFTTLIFILSYFISSVIFDKKEF